MSDKVKAKILDFMYKNGINTSSNKRNVPINDDNIIKPLRMDLINTGIDFVKNQFFVRIRFLGSSKHYEYHFGREDYLKWNKQLANISFTPECDIFDEEEEKVW